MSRRTNEKIEGGFNKKKTKKKKTKTKKANKKEKQKENKNKTTKKRKETYKTPVGFCVVRICSLSLLNIKSVPSELPVPPP